MFVLVIFWNPWWIPGFFQPFFGFQQEAEKCQLSESELRGFVAEAEIDSSGTSAASVKSSANDGAHGILLTSRP